MIVPKSNTFYYNMIKNVHSIVFFSGKEDIYLQTSLANVSATFKNNYTLNCDLLQYYTITH